MAAVAVHLKAGHVIGAAVADNGEVLGRHRENYPVAPRSSGPQDEDLTAAVVATVRALRAPGQRSTVGLAFEPLVGHVPRLQHALEHVQEQVHLETAASAAAWGEQRFGVLRGIQAPQNSLTVTVWAIIRSGTASRAAGRRCCAPGSDGPVTQCPLACRSRSHQTSSTAKWCGGVSYARVTPVRASGSSTRLACR